MKTIINTFAILLLSGYAFAQEISKDSVERLKQEKKAIQIAEELNKDKMELLKLQNELAEKKADVEKALENAQKSADENKTAASALINNPQDDKLSKDAKNAAKKATKDSKDARNKTENQEKLVKNIETLQNKIAKNETELAQIAVPVQNQNVTNTIAKTETTTVPEPVRTEVQPQTNPQSAPLNEQIVRTTEQNYPTQSSSTPSIIINNIVVPPSYNNAQANTGVQSAPRPATTAREIQEYQSWLKSRNSRK